MKRVLILGATSNISHYLIPKLLRQDVFLTLFARHGRQRLTELVSDSKVHVMNGDWNNINDLQRAMKDQDIVFMATSQFVQANKNVVAVMKSNHVNRLITISELGIEDEVTGAFGEWNKKMMGDNRNLVKAADVIKNSGLNYTLMRLAWLYNQDGNEEYETIPTGQAFLDTQLTRQAAAKFIADVVDNPEKASYQSVGVAEPNTKWVKPSFY
ncbi:NAD(P)H-binding protein [uncultured Lentilactobacillus sp.]|uniref:NAD(P)H-binding protein n=1 Tax=uncultured Lentilactobacillus sp. TaxID=2805375 RepID=UPI0025981C8F|nr:NAD(P)H-binding protein [uncultured Lentilactobacillus sp.]